MVGLVFVGKRKNMFCYPESLKHAESEGENHFKKFQEELTFSKGRRESLLCPFLNSPRGLEAAPPFFHQMGVSLGSSKRAKKSFDRRARGSRRRSCSCRWSILCGLEASGWFLSLWILSLLRTFLLVRRFFEGIVAFHAFIWKMTRGPKKRNLRSNKVPWSICILTTSDTLGSAAMNRRKHYRRIMRQMMPL